jgi:hypothetical protein
MEIFTIWKLYWVVVLAIEVFSKRRPKELLFHFNLFWGSSCIGMNNVTVGGN